jgi:hypothetical protein
MLAHRPGMTATRPAPLLFGTGIRLFFEGFLSPRDCTRICENASSVYPGRFPHLPQAGVSFRKRW